MAEDLQAALQRRAMEMVREGKTVSAISEELGISWTEADSLTIGWMGARSRITSLLNRMVREANADKREQMAGEVENYVSFLYDTGKVLRSQVSRARKALGR